MPPCSLGVVCQLPPGTGGQLGSAEADSSWFTHPASSCGPSAPPSLPQQSRQLQNNVCVTRNSLNRPREAIPKMIMPPLGPDADLFLPELPVGPCKVSENDPQRSKTRLSYGFSRLLTAKATQALFLLNRQRRKRGKRRPQSRERA